MASVDNVNIDNSPDVIPLQAGQNVPQQPIVAKTVGTISTIAGLPGPDILIATGGATKGLSIVAAPVGNTITFSISGVTTAIVESGGPTTLDIGAVPDSQFLQRSGATVIGAVTKSFAGGQFGTGVSTSVAAATTNFGSLYTGGTTGISATEANKQVRIPYAGTFRNLGVITTSAQPGAGSLVFTVRKNGVDTAVVATVTAGAAAGVFTDLTHSVAFAAGDLFSLKIQNNDGATPSATFTSFSLEYDLP